MSAHLILRIAGDGSVFTCHMPSSGAEVSAALTRAGEAQRLPAGLRETVRAWLQRSRQGNVPAGELAVLLRRSSVLKMSEFLQSVEIRRAPDDQRLRPGAPRPVSAALHATETGFSILPLVPAGKTPDQYEVFPANAAVFWGPGRKSSCRTPEVYALDWPPDLHAVRSAMLRELSLADVLASREHWQAAGVEGLEYGEQLPEPRTEGPAFLLSVEPRESGGAADRLRLEARLHIAYTLPGDPEPAVFPLSAGREFYEADAHGRVACRRPEAESKLLRNLPLPVRLPFGSYHPAAGKTAEFLDRLEQLEAAGVRVRLHRRLVHLRSGVDHPYHMALRFAPAGAANAAGARWFEGRLEISGLSAEDRAAVLAAIRGRREFVRQANGDWLRMDDVRLQRLRALLAELDQRAVQQDGSFGKFLAAEVARIGVALDGFDLQLPPDAAIGELTDRMRSPVAVRVRPRAKLRGFRGTLRPYQKEGVGFLLDLYECGGGGILADDMGLGKTVQALAFLAELHARDAEATFLVVGPPAALGVWRSAAREFTPGIPLHVHHGPGRNAPAKTSVHRGGIILTTFATLSRDLAAAQSSSAARLARAYHVVLVDEAQYVRNPRAQVARSLRQFTARSIIALTGTPIENHLAELWSLFDLVLPGLLGRRTAFLRRYRNSDADVGELRMRIRPFLLRRIRSDVLTELPPLSESGVVIALEPRQRALYESARRAAVRELRRAGEHTDYVAKVLPHLMRLRRLACHPHLDQGRAADPALSGKFLHLADMLAELRTSAAGILIFSQFTDALDITESVLESLELAFYRIDGRTAVRRREKIVREFQEGRRSVMLISLKAGGTALTLHRADTVIHLDPWWNPAAERQARDRVHRIGQTRPVFVYRLIAEHTIEEKVLELQQRKRALFESVFADGDESRGARPEKAGMLRLLEQQNDRTT